ncbi:MAG: Slp family lipoprotein [Rhodanobacter sp.]
MTTRLLLPLSCLLAVALSACAPAPIYKTAGPATTATPLSVAQSPERFANAQVIWGGRIVQVRNFADHSEIEVLAYALDSSQRPKASDVGSGRFIAQMSGYVEPLDYPAGGLITVAGTLNGSRTGKVGQADYVFPQVNVSQSHVWTVAEMGKGRNNVHFGLGLGVGIR